MLALQLAKPIAAESEHDEHVFSKSEITIFEYMSHMQNAKNPSHTQKVIHLKKEIWMGKQKTNYEKEKKRTREET